MICTSTFPSLPQDIGTEITSPRGSVDPPKASRRGRRSASAAMAWRVTSGRVQLPPIHPCTVPPAVMTAVLPDAAELGRSRRTTVAIA